MPNSSQEERPGEESPGAFRQRRAYSRRYFVVFTATSIMRFTRPNEALAG